MSESRHLIEARQPTRAVQVWTLTFTPMFFGVIFASIHLLSGKFSTTWRPLFGAIELCAATAGIAVFALYRRHRADADGDLPFDWGTLRLDPAGRIRFYGSALLPLGLALAAIGIANLVIGLANATFAATATISGGPRADGAVTTWRIDTNVSRSDADDKLVKVTDPGFLAAELGETVTLSGRWDGIETLTIESVETRTFQADIGVPLSADGPRTYEATCLVVLGLQHTKSGTLHDMHFFFSTAPEETRLSHGAPLFDFLSPIRYAAVDPEPLSEGSAACDTRALVTRGYADITVDPDQALPEGSFLVKFSTGSSIMAEHPPRYLGALTSDGTIVYWDLGEQD